MLPRVIEYIRLGNRESEGGRSSIESILEIVRAQVDTILFTMLLPILKIKSIEEIMTMEQSINILSNRIDPTIGGRGAFSAMLNSSEDNLHERILKVYKILNSNQYDFGADRLQADSLKLVLNNYALKQRESAGSDVYKSMLQIDDLEFLSGVTYAISGTIGTGKTTLLSDIGKCLIDFFESSGKIFYPTYQGEEITKIFCGTTPFAPPASTLLERLTYRLPKEHVDSHKQELLHSSLELLKSFGQKEFTNEKLLAIGSDSNTGVSTGQGKLMILIAAILHKQYLNKPVLFVIDETLANLDKATSEKVCSKIKEIFEDSILISVDHNWESSPSFYDHNVDLAGYSDSSGLEMKSAHQGDLE